MAEEVLQGFEEACKNFTAAMSGLSNAMESFSYALYEWPDEIIEDALDAEFIG